MYRYAQSSDATFSHTAAAATEGMGAARGPAMPVAASGLEWASAVSWATCSGTEGEWGRGGDRTRIVNP